MTDLKIGVAGCAGRMGRAVIRRICETSGCVVAGGVEQPGNEALGQDLGVLAGIDPLGVAASDDAGALFAACDVVIEFAAPDASLRDAALAAQTGTAYVVGTTGLSGAQQAEIEAAAKRAPIAQAANFSLGVNVLLSLTRQLSGILDEDFDIEILEMHHRHKVDAPSGTALALGAAAAQGRKIDLDTVSDRGRDGVTGERKRGDIGFAVLRGGNVAGDHTVIFAAEDERIELTHKATDRAIFARGAVRAALWLADRPAGLYSMEDILGL